MRGSTGVHHLRSRPCFSSSVLPVRLACIVFVIGGRWPYSWRLVGCCYQDFFNIARNINIYIYIYIIQPSILHIYIQFGAKEQIHELRATDHGTSVV